MARFHRDPGARRLKRLERVIRAQFSRLLGAGREPRRIATVDDAPPLSPNARIVFLRQDRIGDALISSPLVHAVRAAFPSARIEMVLSPNNVAARPAFDGAVNAIHVYRKGPAGLLHIAHALRASPVDMIVDCLDNPSSTSALLVMVSGARYALGLDTGHHSVFSHVVPIPDKATVHISDRIRTLATGLGLSSDAIDMRPRYPVSDADAERARQRLFGHDQPHCAIGVNISGSSGLRSFPEETVIAVLRDAIPLSPNVRWLIFGAPYHADVVARVAKSTGAQAVPPSPDFHSYACALRVMDGLVTPDTAAVHLAAAWETPSVVLFSQPDPLLHIWTPYRAPCEAVVTTSRDLAQIPVDQVISGVQRLLGRLAVRATQ
jgi:ADP-heptose:LPS heptosyltransferase